MTAQERADILAVVHKAVLAVTADDVVSAQNFLYEAANIACYFRKRERDRYLADVGSDGILNTKAYNEHCGQSADECTPYEDDESRMPHPEPPDMEGHLARLVDRENRRQVAREAATIAANAKPKRAKVARGKEVAKGVRFEVLKRDSFTCQYCGGKAPDVLLRVDHVVAKANGGSNDVLNLVTACESCNLGKSDKPLDNSAVVAKARNQAEQLQSRREQIEMMAKWQTSLVDLEVEQLNAAHDVVKRLMPGRQLNDVMLGDLRKHLKKYGMEVVLSQFRASFSQIVRTKDGAQELASLGEAIAHAARALKWKERNEADPTAASARYVRGILRKRCPWIDFQESMSLILKALESGVSFDRLKGIAANVTRYPDWSSDMATLLGDP